MSEEDQERLEDYLELERWLEELQAGRVAHPPGELTPTQARIYRLVALFRSTSPEAGTPDPAFAAELHTRLEQEFQQLPKTPRFPLLAKQPQERRWGVSRRALLTGGTAVAASLVAGAAIERALENSLPGSPNSNYPPLVPPGVPSLSFIGRERSFTLLFHDAMNLFR